MPSPASIVSTGAAGLDTVLGGGLTRDRLYLLEGPPGAGKTTLALQFALHGAAAGERVLYVTLSETAEELGEVARSHGWSLDGVHVHEVMPSHEQLDPTEQYTVFHPSEVELGESTRRLLERVDEVKPTRLVFDSMAELRLLAGSALQFRRQVLGLKQYLTDRGCTALLLDDNVHSGSGLQVDTIVHGVIRLAHVETAYGADRRRVRISKMRGRRFIEGLHDYEIRTGGLDVFPRLMTAENGVDATDVLSSGHAQLDLLLGGGLERGTSTLLVGAAGTGKSTLSTQFVLSAVARGENAAMFLFDESVRSLLTRSDGLGFPLRAHVDAERVLVRTVDPAQLSPGEFFQRVREAVEDRGCRTVVIDSLNGFVCAMPGEHYLTLMLHELLSYLGARGVNTFMVTAQLGLIGVMTNPVDVSYLADNVVLLRYFEARGEVRQAISVLKKRSGNHERTIRDMSLSRDGIRIGEPLREYEGVLTGVPRERTPSPPVTG